MNNLYSLLFVKIRLFLLNVNNIRLPLFSLSSMMDVVTSYLVPFQVSLLMLQVPFDHINGQPLYNTSREEASEGISYCRKAYGKNYFFKHITSSPLILHSYNYNYTKRISLDVLNSKNFCLAKCISILKIVLIVYFSIILIILNCLSAVMIVFVLRVEIV